jgi:transcriptional regulator with XRE-family HTH domain
VVRRYEPQPELAAAIRQVRERRGLSQAEVARRADIEPSWLSRLESGSANPSWGTVRRICDALDIPLSELVAIADSAGPERQD